MKKTSELLLIISCLFGACTPTHKYNSTLPVTGTNTFEPLPATDPTEQTIFSLPVKASWQIQYTGDIDLTFDVDIYNLDLFDINSESIAQLHERGIFVMCYFSAGSFEDWRTDANQFPEQVLGDNMRGWPGEKWLDIRQIELLKPIMESRLDLAKQKNCDGVDPDNVNGYENETGFPLTYADQLKFNIFLANTAHERGLTIGLKNDGAQIPELLEHFDWALNEECFSHDECQPLLLFVQAGKPVFVIEYEIAIEEFCPQSKELKFNALYKNLELDAFRIPCE